MKPEIIDVEYVLVEEEKAQQRHRKIYNKGLYLAKLQAVFIGFFWCLIPFGILASIYLATFSKRHRFFYTLGIFIFLFSITYIFIRFLALT